jgi:integrase/recombinase XerD
VPPAVFGAEKRSRPVLRRDTYSTLFALLASTGLRVSEAIHQFDDITPDGLAIQCSKSSSSEAGPG